MSHLVAFGKYYFYNHMKLKIQYRNPLYDNYLVLNFESQPIWRTSIFSSYITSMMPSSLYSIFHKFCLGYMTCGSNTAILCFTDRQITVHLKCKHVLGKILFQGTKWEKLNISRTRIGTDDSSLESQVELTDNKHEQTWR